MPDSLLNNCKAALSHLIASERVNQSANPFKAFSEGVTNFVQHYCHDNHTSSWCHHNKVNKKYIIHYNVSNVSTVGSQFSKKDLGPDVLKLTYYCTTHGIYCKSQLIALNSSSLV